MTAELGGRAATSDDGRKKSPTGRNHDPVGYRSWALPLAGPTDNIIRQWFSGLDMKMNIISPLPYSEVMRQARGKKPGIRFHIQRAEIRQPVPALNRNV